MTIQHQKEVLGFEAEVKQLLKLMVHSLYSNKDIFIRELVSNASDAVDRLRFEALSDAALFENDPDLKIYIDVDKDKKTISIRDNGIGMNREEVIHHLGMIAKSGTKDFLTALTGDQAQDSKLIGQFGVGFYSSFIVADKVVVLTRRAGLTAEHGVRWESTGEGDYTVENIEKETRGTEVILHLREGEEQYLEAWRLREIITRYSDNITVPIFMKKLAEATEKDEAAQTEEYEQVNRAIALWTLPRSEIKEEDYKELYKHISHDFEDPLLWSHNKVEGKLEYISLLYIPTQAPYDLFNYQQRHGVKLYVKRVFIMDDAEQFLPMYLRFVKGVIDCNDLPLNISREILQHNSTVATIRSALTKRVLDMLDKLSREDKEKYAQFWQAFGKVLKEGPAEDFENREKIAKLLRFSSTHLDTEEESISFADYISRMKPNQNKIYYVTADSFLAAKHSPHLEVFRKEDVEVLLLHDRIDEWLVSHLAEFDGKSLQSVAKGSLDDAMVDEDKKQKLDEKDQQDFEDLVKKVKEYLVDRVKDVRLTDRLTESPACIVADDSDLNRNMQRILSSVGQEVPEVKPIFELNPHHELVQKLKSEMHNEPFNEWVEILFDQSVLAEGGHLKDPAGFVTRLNKMLLQVYLM